jgi:murein L,D-transpeptidase YafK
MKNQYDNKKILASLLIILSFWGLFFFGSSFTGAALAAGHDDMAALIPDVFVPFPPKPGSEYVFIVDKSKQTLFLYKYTDKPQKIYELTCSTGKKIGAKVRQGDSKTPEGVYYFIKRHEDNELAPIYGIRAFPTDYPNLMDKQAERTGSAIWLHGTNRKLIPRDSNGCIVLENENIQKLTQYITLNRTPIIILDRLSYTPLASKQAAADAIVALVNSWSSAVEKGGYHEYVSAYDPDYVPDITWWQEWLKFRKIQKNKKKAVSVGMQLLSVFKHNQTYVALVSQGVAAGKNATPVGIKKLFIQQRGKQFAIVGESYQKILFARGKKSTSHPILLAAKQTALTPKPASEKKSLASTAVAAAAPAPKAIEQLVSQWANTWSGGNIPAYGRLYASDFRGKGMNKSQWLKYKKTLSNKYRYIRISYHRLRTRPAKNGLIAASFIQHYKSSAFSSRGIKELLLKREKGEWKIYREKMIKKL